MLKKENFETWVTRSELVALTGLPDRENRREIERLRREGIPIITRRDGKGYKLAETQEELDQFLKMEYYAKINAMRETATAMTSYFSKNGQLSFAGLR